MDRFSVEHEYNDHQKMMQMIKDEGWGDKKYLPIWGRLIKFNVKSNAFCIEHLKTLISKAHEAERAGFSGRGWLRNRLQKADWRRYL